ncbi:hypothetical protein Areg01_71870 [Actinoplanes regularis]|nr:hypothetical protein Areg01_71870 [Actinoplanes regularis]
MVRPLSPSRLACAVSCGTDTRAAGTPRQALRVTITYGRRQQIAEAIMASRAPGGGESDSRDRLAAQMEIHPGRPRT